MLFLGLSLRRNYSLQYYLFKYSGNSKTSLILEVLKGGFMISNPIKYILGLFKTSSRQTSFSSAELLYSRRLKRSSVEFAQNRKAVSNGLAGKIFIAGLAVIFMIAPWRVALAAEFLTLDSFSGTPKTLQVSGGGFTAGETVSIYLGSTGGTPVATAKAGQTTLFGPVAVTIPSNTAQGALSVIAVGSTSNLQASNSYYVVPFGPSISVVSTANTPGSSIGISGAGFAPNETVDLFFDTSAAGSAKADSKGAFGKTAVTIPQVAANTYLIHAKGASSGAEALGYFYVGGFYPTASPDNYFLMPGQLLTFSGSGFAPGETVTLYQGQSQTPLASIKADSTGSFSNAGGITVPASTPGGILNFTLKSNTTNVSVPLLVTIGSFTSLVTPDNYFVQPGQSVKFYGTGFAPNETIQVYQGQGQGLLPIASIKADKGGGFANQATTTIPFNAGGATITFKFVGQDSQTTASVDISVGTLNPQINPSEYYLTPGKVFTIWGTGFAAGEKVDVSAAGTTFTVTTDKYGVFKTSGPFTAPYTPNIQIEVSAVGQTSGVKASLSLSVGSLSPLVSPDSYYITPGDQINLNGSGFAPGEDVNIISGQNILATIPTDQYGNFANQLVTTPFNGGQTINFTFTGVKSGASTNLSVTIAELFPLVSLDNYYAVPGSTIKAQGSGFSRGEPVTITVGGEATTLTATADKNGTTPWVPITLPMDLLDKTLTITFSGDATHTSGTASVTLAPFNPQVSPDTWYTQPGTKVTFSGSGFAARENIAVTFNGTNAGTAVASSTGEFTFSHTIPFTANAAHYTFSGAKSGASASVDISLAPFNPQVSPSTYYAAPGSEITFNGTGFAPGETVNISLNNAAAVPVKADSKGNFVSSAFAVPFGVQSTHFAFTSDITNANLALDIGVAQLNAGIILSTYYATGGAPLMVTGMGFGGGEKVNITFDGAVLGSATTDTKGDFTFKTSVPFGQPGSHTIIATGQNSSAVSTASFTQAQVYTNVQLQSYAGAPGDAVTFIGSGFLPNEPINITTDRTGGTIVHTFAADAKGNFSNSGFVVPATFIGGPLSLTVTGTHSMSSAAITYYVTGP
jgi:large repetitive protein